jgi:uncharacterized protein (TIGR02466 family)
MNIHTWFPTSILLIENLIDDEENKKLIKEIEKLKKEIKKGGDEWDTDLYNTHSTYELHKNIKFKFLCDKIEKYTINFANKLGSDANYKISSSWFNYYNKGDYQEYHIHPLSHFSAVYFFTNPKGSGKLIFKNPNGLKMFPLKNLKPNELSYETCFYVPKEKSLIIFQSDLWHMVQKCDNESPRITGAFNLK